MDDVNNCSLKSFNLLSLDISLDFFYEVFVDCFEEVLVDVFLDKV